MTLPLRRQFTVHNRLPQLAILGILLDVLRNQVAPLFLVTRATVHRFTKMSQRFFGDVKLFVFRPTQVTLGFSYRLFTRRVAVSLPSAGRRHAITNNCLDRY